MQAARHLKAELDRVIAVVRPGSAETAAALKDAGCEVVVCENAADGMGASLACAAREAGEADGYLVALGDMPLVGGRHINRLIAAFSPVEKRTIVVPVHAGERGNPVLWGRRHFAEMLTLDGDRGAKSLMDRHEDQITEVQARTDVVLADFDTPEALARLTTAPQ